jgi:hypothetical protein
MQGVALVWHALSFLGTVSNENESEDRDRASLLTWPPISQSFTPRGCDMKRTYPTTAGSAHESIQSAKEINL